MQYRLVNPEIKQNYVQELLKLKGVEDIDTYLNPSADECLLDPALLENIEAGAELLCKSCENTKKIILLIVDSDNDGFTSSAILYQYIKRIAPQKEITFVLHDGKQHGLEDHMDFIEDYRDSCDLVILPDSSSNDYMYHEQLREWDMKCLVLDHHLADPPFSANAVIINNQLSPNYPNKELTGAGVVYQFCRYLDRKLNLNYADDYIDLAAWGIIGDMGSLLTYENRYIVSQGLAHPTNFFFRTLIEKQSFSMNGEVTPISVAFYIVPLINAMIRVGSKDEKVRLFLAFINGEMPIPSNKRGAKGTMEKAAIESARECTNARNHQNKAKEQIVERLEAKIFKEGLLDNKVLFIRLDEDDDFPSELNGLVAMQLAAKYKKPTIVARLNNEGYIRGSARGLNESALNSFKEFLDTTDMFEYTAGHDNAFGISIPNSRLSEFHKIANEELADIDFGEGVYDVNFVRHANSKDLEDLIEDIYDYREIYGQGFPEPLIYVDNIYINKANISIIGKNKDTVKFSKNGIVYIRFRAKDLIEDIDQHANMNFKIVGRANMNEWNGVFTPQIFIDNYELTETKDTDF